MSEEQENTEQAIAEETAPAVEKKERKRHAEKISYGDLLNKLHASDIKKWPDFRVGDLVKVHYRIKEGDKERIQVYEGNVISIRGEGFHSTFNVRRVTHDVGVERIFPYHSPFISKIEIARRGKVKKAKLFYLRGKSGKESRIKETHRAS